MAIPGDVEIANTISIKNSAPAPIVRSNEALGGIHTVADVTARDAIPSYLRQEGLVAYVQAGADMYQLQGGITNADWVPFGGGGGASSLQDAYEGGASIELTAGDGPVEITNPAGDSQPTLVLTQEEPGAEVLSASGGDIVLEGGNYVVSTGQRLEGTAELTLASLGAGGVVVDAAAAGTSIDFRLGGASAWRVDGATGSLIAVGGSAIRSSGDLSVDAAAASTLDLGAANASVVNVGGAASQTNVGGDMSVAGDTVLQGDLTVNGTTTTINSTTLAVTDRFILCANGGNNVSGGLAVSQANGAGNDLMFMWNDAAGRAEVGFGDSSTNPAGVASFSDLKVSNVFVGGTDITADGSLEVTADGYLSLTATAAELTLAATGANYIAFQTNADDRLFVTSDGALGLVGLGADPAVSAADQARLVYNSSTSTLRASLDGGAYEDLALASSVSLQGAYDGGPTINTTTAQGSVIVSGSEANDDAVVTIAKTPAGAQGGWALLVATNSNVTGDAVWINHQGSGYGLIVDVAGPGTAAIIRGGSISCPVTGVANSERFGEGATVGGIQGTAIGRSANAQFARSIAIGFNAITTGTNGIAIGRGSSAAGVAIGGSAIAAASGSVAIGTNSNVNAGHTGSIVIGAQATSTAANQFVAGSNAVEITDVYFGKGPTNAAPGVAYIHGTSSTGASASGGLIGLRGGTATGAGTGGGVNLSAGAAGATGIGGTVSVLGGAGGTTSGVGGEVEVAGGPASGGNSAGGNVEIRGGSGNGAGSGGSASLTGGQGGATGVGGGVDVIGGLGQGASAGGEVAIRGGVGGTTGVGGTVSVTGGSGGSTSGAGGDLVLSGGPGGVAASSGGSVTIRTAAPGTGTTLEDRVTILPTGLVGVGQTPTSTFHVGGSIAFKVSAIDANAAADASTTIYVVDASGGAVTLTLPPAGDCVDRVYYVKKVDASANAVVVEGNDAETIDGEANQSLEVQYECFVLVSDGTQWWLL